MGRKCKRINRRIETNVRKQVVNNTLLSYGGLPVQQTVTTTNDNDVNDDHDDSEHLCLTFDSCVDDETDFSSPQWFEDVGDEVTEDDDEVTEDDDSSLGVGCNTPTATAVLPEAWANRLGGNESMMVGGNQTESMMVGGNQTMMAEIYYEGMMRGASLSLMDDLLQLFRTRAKQGFDIGSLPRRDTFMKNLRVGMGKRPHPNLFRLKCTGGL